MGDEPHHITRGPMTSSRTYLVECFWPGVDEAMVSAAADRIASDTSVVCSELILVPADEIVLGLFQARSERAVEDATRRADLPCERIIDSIRVRPGSEPMAPPSAPPRPPREATEHRRFAGPAVDNESLNRAAAGVQRRPRVRSATGRLIFFVEHAMQRLRARRLRAAAATSLAAAIALAFACVGTASAAFPGKNGLIAFQAKTGDVIQLYTVRPNGKDLRQITHLPLDATNADWSPDGRRIVFAMGIPGDCSEIAIVDADGSHLTPIPAEPDTCADQPVFTPDGRIVFESFRFDPCCDDALWSMTTSGADRRRITDGVGFGATAPEVSPDGATLSYVGFNGLDFGQGLFTAGLDGANTHQLVPYDADVAIKTDWAPDGNRLLFTDNADFPHPGDSANLATIARDGTDLRHLTSFTGGDVNAFAGSYSPDGRWIVFRLEDHGLYALMRVRPDGTHAQTILPFSTFRPRGSDWGTQPRDDDARP